MWHGMASGSAAGPPCLNGSGLVVRSFDPCCSPSDEFQLEHIWAKEVEEIIPEGLETGLLLLKAERNGDRLFFHAHSLCSKVNNSAQFPSFQLPAFDEVMADIAN